MGLCDLCLITAIRNQSDCLLFRGLSLARSKIKLFRQHRSRDRHMTEAQSANFFETSGQSCRALFRAIIRYFVRMRRDSSFCRPYSDFRTALIQTFKHLVFWRRILHFRVCLIRYLFGTSLLRRVLGTVLEYQNFKRPECLKSVAWSGQ